MSRGLRAWWPVVAWMAVIGVLTSVTIPAGPLSRSELPIDKVAHFVLYLGLGWTVGRALWLTDRARSRSLLAALAAGLAFAALDEWHQGALLAREASLADWLADVAGLSFGLVLYLWPRHSPGATPVRRAKGNEV